MSSYIVPRASNNYSTPSAQNLPGHGLGEFVFTSPKAAVTTHKTVHLEGPTKGKASTTDSEIKRVIETEEKSVAVGSPDKYFTNSIGMKFVYIPPGDFMMGSPKGESGRDNDETLHKVILTKGFYIQTTEVTQGQWKAVMGDNPSYFKNCGDECPVEQLSWNDVQEFIRKLIEMEGGKKYRLPSEAEWEYAARAKSTTAFANGDIKKLKCGLDPNLNVMGWYCGNSQVEYKGCFDTSKWGGPSCAGTHPVGQKAANAWGLFDIHGNVWEWCADWYGDYPTDPITDPTGPDNGSIRVLRGGSWYYIARYCRSAYRLRFNPGPTGSTTLDSGWSCPQVSRAGERDKRRRESRLA